MDLELNLRIFFLLSLSLKLETLKIRRSTSSIFTTNMSRKDEPSIKENKATKDFTCVTFKPDLKKFKMDKLDEDIVALFTKRVYDMAGCTD